MQQVEDPPFLSVGTEVSAKYKGAFCEAKVKKVVRNIKCKIAYKQGLGSGTVSDELIKGVLRVGATVEVKHPDKREYIEATITKIQDCSQYTVVFDDGDIMTLRRTALCLKSGRHFNESETLDQLPLTHPEHFGNPVIGGRRGRRSRHLQDDSSDEDDDNDSKEVINEKEEHIGKVVCVESTETKKKDKEKWFPGLVVSPTAQVTVRIRVKDEYLVRSFKDGRYYTVPKKEAMEFTRELAAKQDGSAVQAALLYLDNSTLPPHWDKDALFGLANSSSEYEGELDSDSSDDEPREEKDHFVAQLYKYMDDRGTPLNKVPSITNKDVDLYRLFRAVQKLGGYNRVTSQNHWKSITMRLGFIPPTVSVTNLVKQAYKKFLQPFEEFDRKLGCSMSMTPRNANRSKGRSLVRANSVASPKPEVKEQKIVSAAEESENTSESSMDAIKSKRKLSTGSGKVKALVDKFEEKCKEELPEAVVCKPIKTTTKEEVIAPSPSGSTSSVPGSSKERKEKTAKRTTPVAQDEKRSGRKRKEGNTEKLGDAPPVNEFPVDIGDKLKVYYHEKKVTYEAKVIETSLQHGTPFYLVHYTGWNTRYDEWVPRERIAENLTTSKAKRSKGGSGNQKSMTNIPPNDGTKSATAIGDKGNTFNVTTLTTNLAVGKNLMASKRGRGRSDSQPPRSTTPSSMASNSSRTKSPAASARRRTTRAQPSGSRRTSNNVSDISMQTESDSDSDEPVKKPTKSSVLHTPMLTASFEPSTSGVCKIGLIKSLAASVTNSQSETEEEEICGSAKGRDYDLNQIRSELKGFKELKSPSPESESAAQVSGERKTTNIFDFEPVDDTDANPLISIIAKSATESKSSSTELSSETDSFADDDSQSSDKTTMLQNMTEKFQQKIKAEKLAQAKCLERLNAGDSVEKIMPLKSSGIEKIIEDSLAEKQQESMKSKPFIIEKRKEVAEKEEIAKVPITETTSPIKAASIDRKSLKIPTSQDKKLIDVPDIQPIVPKVEKKPTVSPNSDTTPITAKPATTDENPVEVIKTEKLSKESGVLCSTADIYEFKEPEPFEFETRKPATTTQSSPEIDKKPQKKSIQKAPETPIPDIKPSTSVVAAKKVKKSPPTEQDKLRPIKIEEKLVIADVTTTSPTILLTPIKNENTFDALRKSPSFNLNITPNEENAQMLQETVKANTEVTDRPSTSAMPSTSSEAPQLTIPFISPFVETLKESPKSAETGNADKDSTGKSSSKKTELETVKRILALDPGFDLEPPKADKWKISIADKVLKALNQQKQEELKPKEEPPAQISFPPIIEAPQISCFAIAEPPKIELPAIIKKEIEIPLKKPILSSPEHKLDILESIAPKNNDLSETIQKLESVIQNRSVVDNFNDDSSDSTDSERRLVIEDDSQSSETNQTDIGYDADAVNKAIFNDEKPFANITDVPFEIYTPKIQPSIFNLQSSPNPALVVPSTSGRSSTPPALHSDVFTPDVEPAIKVENPPIELQNIVALAKPKKEEPPTNQDTSPIMHSEAITLLLCEETIPGSPTPSKESSDIKPNVHPTESDIKPIPMDIECSALPSLPEVSTSAKMKAEMNTPNSSPRDSMSQDESSEDLKKQHDQDSANSPKKRRRTRKHSESEQLNKRRRHNTNVPKRNNASDSDDNSDANLSQRSSNRSARPCQYNFLVQLDPAMNPNQRISILNKKISDLRKTYNMIKAELASIDRRRKKLRRREREKKTQQKINC